MNGQLQAHAPKMRIVYLPAVNRAVTLGQYVSAVKIAIANPDREFTHGLTAWWPTTGAEIARQFLHGIIDRINAGVPYSKRGRVTTKHKKGERD